MEREKAWSCAGALLRPSDAPARLLWMNLVVWSNRCFRWRWLQNSAQLFCTYSINNYLMTVVLFNFSHGVVDSECFFEMIVMWLWCKAKWITWLSWDEEHEFWCNVMESCGLACVCHCLKRERVWWADFQLGVSAIISKDSVLKSYPTTL